VVDIQTISIAIASAGVFAAAIYYIFQIRHQTKIRQTDLVVALSSAARSREFVEALADTWSAEFKDFDDFVKKYGAPVSREPVSVSILVICNFFEHLGVLVKNKLVDAHLVFQLFAIAHFWEKVKPVVEGMRKEFHEPALYEWFEYLYNEVKKREQILKT